MIRYDQGDVHDLRHAFWKELDTSPFLMLQLDADPATAAPMTAQLDEGAEHAIWFFTRRNSHFAAGGPATATFSAKYHDLFARFSGTLSEETDRARLDREWSTFVQAWYPGGKDDPSLLMLRMDLGPAEIWSGSPALWNAPWSTVKTALGADLTDALKGSHAEVVL